MRKTPGMIDPPPPPHALCDTAHCLGRPAELSASPIPPTNDNDKSVAGGGGAFPAASAK